ncbi:MAG: SPOR domain-containing protein [Treponema sp.]|nr:SPOR domain-containing protein [Treponema sp.]
MNGRKVWFVVLLAMFATYAHGQQSGAAVQDPSWRSILPSPPPQIRTETPPATVLPRPLVIAQAQQDPSDLLRLQIGAFRVAANAQDYFTRLSSAGFNTVIERDGDLYRVIVIVRVSEGMDLVVRRLENAGFRSVWRRDAGGSVQTPRAQPATSGRQGVYRVQVGAFSDPANAQVYIARLRSAGFSPTSELSHSPRHGAITRVFIPGVGASERLGIVQRLRSAGFEGTWVRG